MIQGQEREYHPTTYPSPVPRSLDTKTKMIQDYQVRKWWREERTARPCHSRWRIHSRVFTAFAATSTRVLVELGNVLPAGMIVAVFKNKTSLPRMTDMTLIIYQGSPMWAFGHRKTLSIVQRITCAWTQCTGTSNIKALGQKYICLVWKNQKHFYFFWLYHNIMEIECHNKGFHLFIKTQGLFSCHLWICHCTNKNLCFAHFPIDYRLQEAKTISIFLLCYILST